MYRLLADILNDFAFVLDCLSPVFPKAIRVVILSFSSVLRALCGVAAGSAKASLSAHFAQWGNLGELNAKDSSQETVISLLGMLAGSLVVSWVTSQVATWTVLILLLSAHLETNRRAVNAVSMRTLNRQRATLMYHQLMRDKVPKPEDISKHERIFEQDGVLRDAKGNALGSCVFQSSIKPLFESQASQNRSTSGALSVNASWIEQLLDVFAKHKFVINITPSTDKQHYNYQAFLKKGATTADCVAAWFTALAFAEAERSMRGSQTTGELYYSPTGRKTLLRVLNLSVDGVQQLLKRYSDDLKALGWDLDNNALETRSSVRISFPQ